LSLLVCKLIESSQKDGSEKFVGTGIEILLRLLWLWAWRVFAVALLGSAAPALAASCSQATSQGTAPASWQTYCWLDMIDYDDATARSASGQNFSYTLSDGATLTFNLKVTNVAPAAPTTPYFSSITAPSWSGAAVGNTAFLGIPGRPIIYTAAAGTKTITISGIAITPPPGAPAVTAYAFVAADAESTDNGESLEFTTNGGGWIELDKVDPISGSNYPTITGAGISPTPGSATVTMSGAGLPSPTGGYIIGSNSPTTVTATLVAGGLQGVMFAVRFASLRLNKTITGARIAAADQFKFDIKSTGSGSILATGTSTGTGNGPFTAAAVSLASGIPLTIAESMAFGSTSALIQYRSRLNCINGTPGSSTPLPSNVTLTPTGGTASYSFGTLQFGDAIQCTFNNAAFPHLRVEKVLGAGGRLFNTDQFTVNIQQGATTTATATTTGTGTTVTTGTTALTQVTAGTAYSVSETAAGTTTLSQYTQAIGCTNGAASSSTTLPTVLGGTVTPQLGDVITCTITNTKLPNNATLTILKSSTAFSDPINNTTNPKMIPGGIVRYSILVANTGTLTVTNNSVFIIDNLPSQISVGSAAAPVLVNGTPTANLTLTPATDVRYSNQVTAPTTFATCSAAPHNYTPTSAYDPNVRHVCIRPQGTMAAATAAGQPNFTVSFLAQIN
jgi:uncharacterized repeat protein (TIGR01451 family)